MKKPDKFSVGGRIRIAQESQTMKTKDLAKMVNISPNYLSMVEGGQRNPSDELLRKIAEATSTNYEWLKNGDGKKAMPVFQPEATSTVTAGVPDMALFLQVLELYRPDIFPDIIKMALEVNDQELADIRSGKTKWNPKWRYAVAMLAQRLGPKADEVCDKLDTLTEFLREVTDAPDLEKITLVALQDYLLRSDGEGYKLTSNLFPVERFDPIEEIRMKLTTITFSRTVQRQEMTRTFDCLSGTRLPDPDSYDPDDPENIEKRHEVREAVSDIVSQHMEAQQNSTGELTVVFYDTQWEDLYADCAAEIRDKADLGGQSLWEYGSIKLLVIDITKAKVVKEYTFDWDVDGDSQSE